MTTLTVGAGKTYSTINAAVTAAQNGDIIQVQAGTYTNDFSNINKNITIQGVGGLASIVATVSPPNGKAILTLNGNITLDHIELSGAAVRDQNGAGIRFESGSLNLTNSYIHDNQEGLLAGAGTGSISISNSEFARNGAGDGYSHNLYVGAIASLTIDNSYFHDASVGHEIKSRAARTTITNSRIFDLSGTASYSIDLPNGGVAVIQNNVIQQGPNSQNPNILAFGEEGGVPAGSSLLVAGNTILNDLASGSARALWNASAVQAVFSGNSTYGLSAGQLTTGPVTVVGNTFLPAEPGLVTTSPIGGGGGAVPVTVPTPGGGATPVTVPTTGGGIVAPTPGATPTITFPAPVAGVSTIGISSLNISTLLGAGYRLQFLAGLAAVQLVDGVLSVGADTNPALVQRLYLGLLGRASEPSGMAGFNQMLNAGVPASNIAAIIMGGAEYAAAHGAQTNAQFVVALFQGMLGRTPPAGDQAGFTAALDTTMSRADLAVMIANSAEAKAHNSGATAQIFVRDPAGTVVHDLFQTGLGREVEWPSLAPMANNLRSGAQTPAQLAQIIAGSAEFAGLHGVQSDAAYVTNLYQTALGRMPGQTELLGWSNNLNGGGQTRADVLLAIGTSAEAQGHLTAAL